MQRRSCTSASSSTPCENAVQNCGSSSLPAPTSGSLPQASTAPSSCSSPRAPRSRPTLPCSTESPAWRQRYRPPSTEESPNPSPPNASPSGLTTSWPVEAYSRPRRPPPLPVLKEGFSHDPDQHRSAHHES